MPRRVSLPGADELFRSTTTGPSASAGSEVEDETAGPDLVAGPPDSETSDRADRHRSSPRASTRPSRRERHSEKITVYVSDDELIELERSRLTLRATHGLGVDRGRIVREALAVVLADFAAKGSDSILVRRLRA